jgi:hypothetical protein
LETRQSLRRELALRDSVIAVPLFFPSAKLLQIALMISGSVRGVAKSITIVALEAHPTVGSTPADLMMSRAALTMPLTYRTNTRLQPFPLLTDPGLTEESIPDC